MRSHRTSIPSLAAQATEAVQAAAVEVPRNTLRECLAAPAVHHPSMHSMTAEAIDSGRSCRVCEVLCVGCAPERLAAISSSKLISVTNLTNPWSDACDASESSAASFLRMTATLEPCVPSEAAPCFYKDNLASLVPAIQQRASRLVSAGHCA